MSQLRDFSANFILAAGSYLHHYKGNLPDEDGTFDGFETQKVKSFIEKYPVDFKKVENFSAINISREFYLNFIFEEYDETYGWVTYAQKGRSHALPSNSYSDEYFMHSDDEACLVNLNLTEDEMDENGENWWFRLSSFSRNLLNKATGEIGREGEDLSYAYELKRLGGRRIKKYYIDDNMIGFDILSWKNKNTYERLQIEVKSTTQNIQGSKATITRNQWEHAKKFKNGFQFHFWLLSSKELAIINFQDLEPHVPLEQKKGRTETFSVPFKAFSDKFKKINL